MKFKNAVTKEEYDMLYKALRADLEHQKMISFVGAGGRQHFFICLQRNWRSWNIVSL